MADNVYGERFYGFETGAWHKHGFVGAEKIGAVEAFEQIGRYQVEKVPLATADGLAVNYSAIVRAPTADDDERRVFGVVSNDYKLITPDDVCQVWDRDLRQPVETMVALAKGKTFLLTSRLEDYDVKGDPIRRYLSMISPMSGTDAARVIDTSIRIVCENTMNMALNEGTELFHLRHSGDLDEKFGAWLREMYDMMVARAGTVKEVFEAMADTRLETMAMAAYAARVYPVPKEPAITGPKDIVERRMARYEQVREKAMDARATTVEYFEGLGTGMGVPSCDHTLFGGYNAIVEYEDYHIKPNISVLTGARAETKSKAYSLALQMLGGQTDIVLN